MVKVLYLFAGRQRRGDMGYFLRKLFKAKDIEVNMVEVDVLRGGRRHNLLQISSRTRFMKEVEARLFDVVLASPPCSTFSRARCAGDGGPRPLRSSKYQRGFPWLTKAARITVDEASSLVDFTAAVLRAQMSHGGVVYLNTQKILDQYGRETALRISRPRPVGGSKSTRC